MIDKNVMEKVKFCNLVERLPLVLLFKHCLQFRCSLVTAMVRSTLVKYVLTNIIGTSFQGRLVSITFQKVILNSLRTEN